jgi:hypothetical protein
VLAAGDGFAAVFSGLLRPKSWSIANLANFISVGMSSGGQGRWLAMAAVWERSNVGSFRR